jgi:hypothetical protein
VTGSISSDVFKLSNRRTEGERRRISNVMDNGRCLGIEDTISKCISEAFLVVWKTELVLD